MEAQIRLTQEAITVAVVLLQLLLRAGPSYAAPFPEPVARANNGQVQCYAPDLQRKTCRGIAAFEIGSDGKLVATARILVSDSPRIIMTGKATVFVRSGNLCGRLTGQDIEDASFSDGVNELEPLQASLMRKIVETVVADALGREICGVFLPHGRTLIVRPTLDGAPMSVPEQDVIWVHATDSYRIGD